MVAVHEFSWEEMSAPDFGSRAAWRDAVAEIAARAHEKLPECNGRVDSAVKIVLAGDVELLPDNTAKVASQSNGQTVYRVVNGQCDCKDFAKAPHGFCKHRLSAAIARRAQALVKAPLDAGTPASQPVASAAPQAAQGIAPEHVVMIQGKPFVRFAGLLQMAQARGLVSLTAVWTFNDAELSLAQAVATFEDGRRFEEAGDATPANTTRKVALHFRRVALTRAKARALRDALGVDLVAVEELADSE